ncbi:hypothetical protein LCGC14_0595880 [marine sediment metagenome]|uniref:Uncharacterized protein n=1 Tax=marine sediment metagenome TaxID=412755 RepID=A0A0F9RH03_9ZZZZ|nr:hypothetical protein [bacterium]
MNKKDNLKDFSDEYEVIVSTNKNIGKEFIQCLHEYRSRKVNSSHLKLEDLFNPLRLYNYLRNKHWKEGIPEAFLKEWASMNRSQYTLTEGDKNDFEAIFRTLQIGVEIFDLPQITPYQRIDRSYKNKCGEVEFHENIQRIEYYKLTSKNNRIIALNMLKKENGVLIKKLNKLMEFDENK